MKLTAALLLTAGLATATPMIYTQPVTVIGFGWGYDDGYENTWHLQFAGDNGNVSVSGWINGSPTLWVGGASIEDSVGNHFEATGGFMYAFVATFGSSGILELYNCSPFCDGSSLKASVPITGQYSRTPGYGRYYIEIGPDPTTAHAPEPAAWQLLALGIPILVWRKRKLT